MSEEVETILKEIMSAVFEVPLDTITSQTSVENIDEWDSLKHISLIAALEEEFGKEYDEEAILRMTNFESILKEVI